MHVIPQENYTLDATAGTITLSSPYNSLDLEQFIYIVDLDTNDVIYDVHLKRDGVTFSNGVLTYTADNNITNDTDNIRIVINDTSGTTQTIGGYNTTLDALKIYEQSPLDQQMLDETPLNAVTTAQTSTYITVMDKEDLTVEVYVTSGATGGTITLKTHDSSDNVINVPFIDTADDSINTSKVCTTGGYIFKLTSDLTLKDLAVDLSSVTDGTFTVSVYGGAI